MDDATKQFLEDLQGVTQTLIRAAEALHRVEVTLTFQHPETSAYPGELLDLGRRQVKQAAKNLEQLDRRWKGIVKKGRGKNRCDR